LDHLVHQIELEGKQSEVDAIAIKDSKGLAEYYDIRQQLDKAARKMREIMTQPLHILPFLNPGRLVRVKQNDLDWGWGVIINFQKKTIRNPKDKGTQSQTYVMDVLLVSVMISKVRDTDANLIRCLLGCAIIGM
jgi:ATP-dependent RNA helicase DOB1